MNERMEGWSFLFLVGICTTKPWVKMRMHSDITDPREHILSLSDEQGGTTFTPIIRRLPPSREADATRIQGPHFISRFWGVVKTGLGLALNVER